MPSLLRSEEHTSELQSLTNLVCRLLLEKKKKIRKFEAANFYRDSTKREVDIITRTGKSVLPIEVGFTEEIHSIANLEYFMSKNNLLTGMLLSKKQMELRKIGNKKIVILPFTIYLGMGDIY